MPSVSFRQPLQALVVAMGFASALAIVGCATVSPGPPPRSVPVAPDVVATPPRLMVVVVVDQLRADHVLRFRHRFAPASASDPSGGFRWLDARGAAFPYAEFNVANALTAPGHATVATGAWPARHGLVMNSWTDAASGERRYSVGDPAHTGVGSVPTGPIPGTSPANLMGPTLGDTLKTLGVAERVISLSIKDRAAILMGGHRAELALWFDARHAQWVTSTYYRPGGALPAWVDALNDGLRARGDEVYRWGEGTGYGRDHARASADAVKRSPLGLELTVDAALAAVDAYALGQRDATDVLWVSLSPLDYLGHEVGPTHPLMEELVVHHDRALARLTSGLAARVPGAADSGFTLVVTGDHGAPPTPEVVEEARMPGQRLDDRVIQAALEASLRDVFGAPPPPFDAWIVQVVKLHVTLNERALAAAGHALQLAEGLAADRLRGVPGVAHVARGSRLSDGLAPPGLYGRQIMNGWFPGRSGHVIGLPGAYVATGGDPVIHMTGHTYDRMVPLWFVGRPFRAGVFPDVVQMVDVAPTLALVAGTVPPALSEGRVLSEALRRR